jgi:hypothetical protein
MMLPWRQATTASDALPAHERVDGDLGGYPALANDGDALLGGVDLGDLPRAKLLTRCDGAHRGHNTKVIITHAEGPGSRTQQERGKAGRLDRPAQNLDGWRSRQSSCDKLPVPHEYSI